MELRTLGYFVAVAEEGSLSAAARTVLVTQPALSRQIRQLEHELRLRLFDRRAGRLWLTAGGRQFLPVARDLLEGARAARAAAQTFAAGRLVNLTIAAPTTTLTDVVAPFLATLEPDDPLPAVVETDGPAALQTLHHGTDLAIVTHQPPASWKSAQLAVMPMWAYVSPEHPWALRDFISLPELVTEPLLLLDQSFRPRQILQDALTADRVTTHSVIECGNAEVALALAAAGRGVAVVSDDPRFGLHGIRVVAENYPLQISLHAAWDPNHHAAALLSGMASRLRTFCSERYGEYVAP